MIAAAQLSATRATFPVRDYALGATLGSGQAFRWRQVDNAWVGIVGKHMVRLSSDEFSITAETAVPTHGWDWLVHYLQLNLDLPAVLQTFPVDAPMTRAVEACRGLRLLRQDPWECLASFICSSTKQIVQIQQIVGLLCERFGEPLLNFPEYDRASSFPSAARLARATERELRDCKMGFRAPYLLESARGIAQGSFDLEKLRHVPVDVARAELLQLPGVGGKIADCVLLFAYGFPTAFPVDVWVMKALRQLYFPRRRVRLPKLQAFAGKHFGPWSGYAQQYLFHYMRTMHTAEVAKRKLAGTTSTSSNSPRRKSKLHAR